MHRLLALADLADFEPVVVTMVDREIAVVRVEEDVFAFSAVCTHRAAPLVNGAVTRKRTILCPWHLGTFSLRTGKALAGPQTRPLPVYPIAIVDGEVFLDAEPGELPVVEFDHQHLACRTANQRTIVGM